MSDSATAKPTAEAKRPKQGRSPAYPAIAVQEAIEKAKALYDAHGKYPAPMPLAFDAWGYGTKSSSGRDVRSALKYFGLITVDGEGDAGKVKLTDEALRILLDEREDQTEKKAIIRRVALNPTIHKRLLEEFPDGIKSDAAVEHFLVFDQEYNKSAAGAVVAEFKATAAYAELYKPDNVVVKEDQVVEEPDSSNREALNQRRDPPKNQTGKVTIMAGERVAFTEESGPGQYLKLIASGEFDDTMLEALESFVKRQRKRLERPKDTGGSETGNG